MPRLVAHMVTRNEAGRWLELTLPRLVDQFGEVTVYDDQSTDATVDIAQAAGATVWVRPDEVPSFAAHEGAFRQAAWEWTIRTKGLHTQSEPGVPDCWILSLDADEALPSSAPDQIRYHVEHTVEDEPHVAVFEFRVHEVFDLTATGFPQVRYDGEWGNIRAARLGRAFDTMFPARPAAGGSLPETPRGWGRTTVGSPAIWHLGYLRDEDRTEKHARYSGTRGHGRGHVASIVTRPSLRPIPVEDPDRPFWKAVQRKLT